MRIWDVYPAIDLRRGRVVRLTQGDPAREKMYSDDPPEIARRWQEEGATWLHVVNLDGAFGEQGGDLNRATLEHILTVGLRVQFGGGLRDMEALRRALDLGVSRAVIGTAAVENPALVAEALTEFGPERVAVAVDARRGQVHTHGWAQGTALTALELAQRCADWGVRWVIFTDTGRDGTGGGLNLETTEKLAQVAGLQVIASGGVCGLEDVRQAYRAGFSGVIVGRALYEGQVSLRDVLRIGEVDFAG